MRARTATVSSRAAARMSCARVPSVRQARSTKQSKRAECNRVAACTLRRFSSAFATALTQHAIAVRSRACAPRPPCSPLDSPSRCVRLQCVQDAPA